MRPFCMAGLMLISLFSYNHGESTFKMCASSRSAPTYRCNALERGNSQVSCVTVTDSVDCALKLQSGLVDFGVFNAEEALLASKFINSDGITVAELRHKERANVQFAYQAVAVVKRDYRNGSLANLRGKKFCHPGFQPTQHWTDRALKEFERAVVGNSCNGGGGSVLSIAEREVSSLSQFFQGACRPGPWVYDTWLDNKLKQDYNNLCALCDSHSGCSYNSELTGSHKGALACLTESGGDVAYVALQHVQEFFGITPGFKQQANQTDYSFLCRNGSTMPLNSSQPCTWLKQPWSSIVSTKSQAKNVQKSLMNWIGTPGKSKEVWQDVLLSILLEDDHVFIQTQDMKPIAEYVQNGRGLVETSCAVSETVRWCTVNAAEQRKCEWVRQAGITHGIVPELTCVYATSMWHCFKMIATGKVDIIGIDTEYSHIVRNVFNLSSVAYQDSMHQGNYHIIAVMRAINTVIKSFKNLKNAKACFPEYGGLAMIATGVTLQQANMLGRECWLGALSKLFSEACTPGAKDPNHAGRTRNVPESLCSLCPGNNVSIACGTVSSNPFYGDLGAMRCLSTGSGDIAFVDYRQLLSRDSGELEEDIEPNAYKVLCRNGSLSLYHGLTVDENCAFAVGVGAEIVSRENRTKVESQNLAEMLLAMDKWFGTFASNFEGVIQMFNQFQGRKGLLFKETTVSLVHTHDQNYKMINTFIELQRESVECSPSKTNPATKVSATLVFLISVVMWYH